MLFVSREYKVIRSLSATLQYHDQAQSVSLSLSLTISIYLCLYLYLTLHLVLSLYFSLTQSHDLSISLSLYPFFIIFYSSLNLLLSLFYSLSLYFFLPFTRYLSIYLSKIQMKKDATEWILGSEEGRTRVKEKIIALKDSYTSKLISYSTAGVETEAKVIHR